MSEQPIEPYLQTLDGVISDLWRELGEASQEDTDRRIRLRAAIDLIHDAVDTIRPDWACGCDICQDRLEEIYQERKQRMYPEADPAPNQKRLYRFALTTGNLQVIFGVRADSPEHAVELANQGFEHERWAIEVDMGVDGLLDYFETQIDPGTITIDHILPWDRRKPGDWWIVDEAGMVEGEPYPDRESAEADYIMVCDEHPYISFYVASTEELERRNE